MATILDPPSQTSRRISTDVSLKSLPTFVTRDARERRSIIEDSSRRLSAESASKRQLGATNKKRNVRVVWRSRPEGPFADENDVE